MQQDDKRNFSELNQYRNNPEREYQTQRSQNMMNGNDEYGNTGWNSAPMPERLTKKIWNQTTLSLFIMGLTVVLIQIISSTFLNAYFPQITNSDWYVWALTAFTMIGIALPLIYLLTKHIPDSPKRAVVKLKPTQFFGIFMVCTCVMYITNFFSMLLLVLIALIKGESFYDLNPLTELFTNGNLVYSILYAAIAAPIIEELIFRKLLLSKLRRYGDIPAILLTAFAFGLFHMNLSQFFYATALGMIFAYVTIRTNTVRYSILLHIMINTIGTAIAPLAVKSGMIFSLLITLWVFSAIAAGIVIFVLNVKKVKLYRAVWPLSKKSDYFLNPGIILYTLLCLVMTILVTIR